jgi:hypothetical protein
MLWKLNRNFYSHTKCQIFFHNTGMFSTCNGNLHLSKFSNKQVIVLKVFKYFGIILYVYTIMVPLLFLWYLRFSQWWRCHVGLLSCNTMWTCRYVPVLWRNMLSENGDSMFIQNVGIYLLFHTVLHPRRQTSTLWILVLLWSKLMQLVTAYS